MDKDYSLKIDENGNVNFQFDKTCLASYGNPTNVTSKTSVELIPGTKDKAASIVKTTVIKEQYQLKEREIQKEDLNFALNLISSQHSVLTLDLLPINASLIPGSLAYIKINKVKNKDDLFKVLLDFEYNQYFEGELESKKIKEKGAFLMNKDQIVKTYDDFKHLDMKESISLLQSLKLLLKELLISEENESIKPEHNEEHTEKARGKEIDDDDDERIR